MNRKCVLIDGNVLYQRTLSLYDFSKGSAEMSDTKPFTSKVCFYRSIIDLDREI